MSTEAEILLAQYNSLKNFKNLMKSDSFTKALKKRINENKNIQRQNVGINEENDEPEINNLINNGNVKRPYISSGVPKKWRGSAHGARILILEGREEKINKMISGKEDHTKIITKIKSLKNYSDKNPSNFNLVSALTKFRNKGFTLNGNTPAGGGNKEYINLQSGGKRLIRYGSRGGRYYMKGGNKVYIN
jgi:hypothetical protein